MRVLKVLAGGVALLGAGACQSEPIQTHNENERIVLQAIRAAERGDEATFDRLAGDAVIVELLDNTKRPMGIKDLDRGACELEHLVTLPDDGQVGASWECPYIQGYVLGLHLENGRIVAADFVPGE